MTQKKPTTLSRNNILSVGILALGVLALLFVGYFVYKNFLSADDGATDGVTIVTYSKDKNKIPNRAAGEKLEEPFNKNVKNITEQELRGEWESTLERGTAFLEMKKGKYRLIVIPGKKARYRLYSNGTYKIQDSVVILEPDLQAKAPKGYKYELLTRSIMPMEAVKYQGKLIWQKPPNDFDMYVPPYNSILERTKNKIVVWNVLE